MCEPHYGLSVPNYIEMFTNDNIYLLLAVSISSLAEFNFFLDLSTLGPSSCIENNSR